MFDFFAHKDVFFDRVIKLTVREHFLVLVSDLEVLCCQIFRRLIHFKFVLFLSVFFLLQVIHSKMLRSFSVGSFKVDVWTVYKQPGSSPVASWLNYLDNNLSILN